MKRINWKLRLKNKAALASIIGVLVDPTTSGIGDSDQAMSYDEPRKGENDVKGN